MSAFSRVAGLVARRPVAVIVIWGVAALSLLALAVMGLPGQGGIDARTSTGPPLVKQTDSYAVFEAVAEARDPDAGTLISARLSGVDPSDPGVLARVQPVLEAVAADPQVALVATPSGAVPGPRFGETAIPPGDDDPRALLGAGGDELLVVVTVGRIDDGDARLAVHERVRGLLEGLPEAAGEGADARVFSDPLLYQHFSDVLKKDLVSGELIAIPLALIVMVLVFGGFLAASTPVIGALASIAGGLGVLYAFTFAYDVDESAQNVVTVLGLGLCIDYGLLIVSRFREELLREHPDGPAAPGAGDPALRERALTRAMETAGRTVFFSAVTVAIAVAGMLLLAPEITKAFGGAAVGVVVVAMLAAMTLAPAVAYLYGERLVAPGPLSRLPGVRALLARTADVRHDHGFFSRLAGRVQRRPWLVLGGTTALLLVMASPVLGLQMRNSQHELLPRSSELRQYLDDFNQEYPALSAPAIEVLAVTTPQEFDAWAPALGEVPGVLAVRAAAPWQGDGLPAEGLPEGRGLSPDAPLVLSGLDIEPSDHGSREAVDIVRGVRALDPPFELLVGGQAANQLDFTAAVRDGAPVALAIVVLATFVLLFLMTGSLLVPAKALAVNTLSLSASLGVVVWVFQQGHLSGLLGFQPTGGVETYVVVLIIAFGFGLAMDYEVFLLARIKEQVDRGVPNDEAVRIGLQRSGRIVTSAAAIIILVFLGFAAGQTLVIKEVGFGLAFAVLLDATIVRLLLVPASMTLLGDRNWWAPTPLRRLYARARIDH